MIPPRKRWYVRASSSGGGRDAHQAGACPPPPPPANCDALQGSAGNTHACAGSTPWSDRSLPCSVQTALLITYKQRADNNTRAKPSITTIHVHTQNPNAFIQKKVCCTCFQDEKKSSAAKRSTFRLYAYSSSISSFFVSFFVQASSTYSRMYLLRRLLTAVLPCLLR